MSDMISEFIDAIVGEDPEVRKELEAARLRLEAGREIHLLRKDLDLSVDQFADILGVDREQVERLEIGNFEESGSQIMIGVIRKVRAWLEEIEKPEKEEAVSPDFVFGKTRSNNHQRKFTA